MEEVQYRIGTVIFTQESCPTWGTRSVQILDALAGWARGGWQISRLNASAHIRLRARGFCVLLERPLRESAIPWLIRRGKRDRKSWKSKPESSFGPTRRVVSCRYRLLI